MSQERDFKFSNGRIVKESDLTPSDLLRITRDHIASYNGLPKLAKTAVNQFMLAKMEQESNEYSDEMIGKSRCVPLEKIVSLP